MKPILGHGLYREGKPQDWHSVAGAPASGACQCGVLSAPLTSDSKRKAWHKQHKSDVLHALSLLNEQEIDREAARIWGLKNTKFYSDQNALVKSSYRTAAMYELLRRIDPDHPAFGDGRISESDNV